MFQPNDRVEPELDRAAGEVIDGEAIIINLVTGVYYSMQGIGGVIWSMIEERRSVASMLEQIVASYDVDRDTARADLDAVLEQLAADGLVRVAPPDGNHAAPVTPSETKQPYVRPELQVYRDMEDLLALDPPAPGMNQIVWKS